MRVPSGVVSPYSRARAKSWGVQLVEVLVRFPSQLALRHLDSAPMLLVERVYLLT